MALHHRISSHHIISINTLVHLSLEHEYRYLIPPRVYPW
jgi:hypothetical protein